MLFCGQIFRYDQRMLNMLFGEFKAKADRLHIWKGTKKTKYMPGTTHSMYMKV